MQFSLQLFSSKLRHCDLCGFTLGILVARFSSKIALFDSAAEFRERIRTSCLSKWRATKMLEIMFYCEATMMDDLVLKRFSLTLNQH